MPRRYDARLVGLAPERDALYQAIDARVDAMIAAGLEAEVAALRAAGFAPPLRSQQAIGYAELHEVAAGALERARGDRADQKEFKALRPPSALVVPRRDRDDHLAPGSQRR